MPEPIAAIAPSSAMPVGTRSRGNSSRMIPNDSGKTPPPRPCSPRPTIISPSELDSAATTEPTANSASEIASRRSLPNMSPRRPKIGVAIEATSRYAVTIQAIPLADAPSSRWRSPSAGMTVVCARTKPSVPMPRMSSVRVGSCSRGWSMGSRDPKSWLRFVSAG